MTTTSRKLLLRVRDKDDAEAWQRFHDLYAPLVLSYARAHGLAAPDAEELRDHCMAIVARKMPTFEYDAARGGFKGWLYKVAKGAIVDQLRRPSPRRAETEELGALQDVQPTPDELWEHHWREEHLRFCLAEVRATESDRNFRVFELLLFEDASVPDVCERLGLNANQVYKAKSRVLARVREVMQRLGDEADRRP